jgi:ATP-binding cassette subfamily F protein 3
VLVADGKAQAFDGDLEDYSLWLNEQRLKEKQAVQSLAPDKPNKNDRAQSKAERQARIAERRPLLKELEQIERNMAQMQADKKVCDDRLNDTELYSASDKSELQQLLKTQAELTAKLESAEERWLELHEMLEALPVID